MLRRCVQPGYNDQVFLWGGVMVSHRLFMRATEARVKLLGYTLPEPKLSTKLCTFYAQSKEVFISVSRLVVHIIHRAYKEQDNLKKGIIL